MAAASSSCNSKPPPPRCLLNEPYALNFKAYCESHSYDSTLDTFCNSSAMIRRFMRFEERCVRLQCLLIQQQQVRDDMACRKRCSDQNRVYIAKDARAASRQRLAEQEAVAASRRWPPRRRSICTARTPELANASGELLAATQYEPWRYYSLIDCGQQQRCLVFKKALGGVGGGFILSRPATDAVGLNFSRIVPLGEPLFSELQPGEPGADLPGDDRLFAHNFAVLSLGNDEYAMVGGMGIESWASGARASVPSGGIRFARGRGWPWSRAHWSVPKIVINALAPAGCIDRRPSRTPQKLIERSQENGDPLPEKRCEWDGRLSLAHWKGAFRLYARANLFEHALAGGRFVQTTTSVNGMGNWSRWRLVRIASVPAGSSDVYFFHVQRNPVDEASLIAIFPLSRPPHACIAIAFSSDGLSFSTPVALRRAGLGWRTGNADGTGQLEWRTEDHPVAGVVTSTSEDAVYFYIHHDVKGMSMRPLKERSCDDATLCGVARVARYKMPAERLRTLAKAGLKQLSRGHRRVWRVG